MYKIAIKNILTDKIAICQMADDWGDVEEYWWTEGNASCDCNRYLEFERGLGNEPDWDKAICGEERYAVLYVELPNGERIKIDSL